MFSFERRLQRLRLFLPFVLCAASVRVLAQCPSTTRISPSIREIRVGEEAFLRCQDQDRFSVTSPRFFRDGVLVQIGGRVDNSGSGQIRVSSVQISDEGEYTCLPASSAGCSDAIQSTIGTVLVNPEIDTDARTHYTVAEGEVIVISCGLSFGNLRHTYRVGWRDQNGRTIVSSDSVTGMDGRYVLNENTFQLIISDTQLSDSRVIPFDSLLCRSMGSQLSTIQNPEIVDSNSIQLSVLEKPIIVSLSNPLAVVIGDDITAECVVDWPVDPSLSSQSVEVQWSLNSQQIVAGTSVIVLPGNRRRYIVELNEVELAHSGLLKCQAFREVNVFSERETTIVVLFKPTLVVSSGSKVISIMFGTPQSTSFNINLYALEQREYPNPDTACRGQSPFFTINVPPSQTSISHNLEDSEDRVPMGSYILSIQMYANEVSGPCVISSEPLEFGRVSLSSGEVAGIVFGVILLVVILTFVTLLLIVCLWVWYKRKQHGELNLAVSPTDDTDHPMKQENLGNGIKYNDYSTTPFGSLFSLNKSRSAHASKSNFELNLSDEPLETKSQIRERQTSVSESWIFGPSSPTNRNNTFPHPPKHGSPGNRPSYENATLPFLSKQPSGQAAHNRVTEEKIPNSGKGYEDMSGVKFTTNPNVQQQLELYDVPKSARPGATHQEDKAREYRSQTPSPEPVPAEYQEPVSWRGLGEEGPPLPQLHEYDSIKSPSYKEVDIDSELEKRRSSHQELPGTTEL